MIGRRYLETAFPGSLVGFVWDVWDRGKNDHSGIEGLVSDFYLVDFFLSLIVDIRRIISE
jgi:hypothetical protein